MPHASEPSYFGPGLVKPDRMRTHSSLAAWSWYDVARRCGAGVAGGVLAVMVSAWWPLQQSTGLLHRYLLWGLPIVLGLCLAEGQLHLAPRVWRWGALRAGCCAAGLLLLASLAASGTVFPPTALLPALFTWYPLGGSLTLACAIGFPRERTYVAAAIAGLGAGGIMAVAAPPIMTAIAPLPGLLGRLAVHLALLPLFGGLLGVCAGLLREVGKRHWLQVVFGEQPCRHYLLSVLPLTIGTADDNTLVLEATGGVQPHHAIVRRHGAQTSVEICDSQAVIILHQRRCTLYELFDGDEFQIGETVLRLYTVE